jgi:hypothetical protein
MLIGETGVTELQQRPAPWGSARFGRRAEQEAWSLGEAQTASALQVAQRLFKLDGIRDLSYRGVPLEADAVDITPCDENRAKAFYRYYIARPTASFVQALSSGSGATLQWRSEVLILPRVQGDGMMARLAPFEAEFAVRSFLRRVEREIDALLAQAGDALGG